MQNVPQQKVLGWAGIIILTGFLMIHIWKDLTAAAAAWYYHSTAIWIIVMFMGSIIFFVKFDTLKKRVQDLEGQAFIEAINLITNK